MGDSPLAEEPVNRRLVAIARHMIVCVFPESDLGTMEILNRLRAPDALGARPLSLYLAIQR